MKHIKKFNEFLNENLNEKKSKSDYEDLMGELESKIWELKNSKKSWIPEDPAKRDKMIASYQKKFDAAKKKFDAFLDEGYNDFDEYDLTNADWFDIKKFYHYLKQEYQEKDDDIPHQFSGDGGKTEWDLDSVQIDLSRVSSYWQKWFKKNTTKL